MTNEILLWENTEIFSVQVFVQMRGFKSVGSTSVKPQKALEPFYHLSYSILNPSAHMYLDFSFTATNGYYSFSP